MDLREKDLELGETTSDESLTEDHVNINNKTSKLPNGVLDFNESLSEEPVLDPSSNAVKFGSSNITENVELRIDKKSEDEHSQEHVAFLKMKLNEKCKKNRPPRPPKGPSLDVADIKLIKEIADLAMRKRIRNERVKALKKKRAAKSSSSSSNSSVFAMVITLLFFLIVILHGIYSRGSSSSKLQEHLEPAAVSNRESLISVEYPKKILSVKERVGMMMRGQ